MLLKYVYFNEFEKEPTYIMKHNKKDVVVAIEEDGYMFVSFLDGGYDLSAYIECLAVKFVEGIQKYPTTISLVEKHLKK